MTESIMHLIHGEMLNLKSVGDWVGSFEDLTRKSPSSIVLPGLSTGGPTYDSSIQPPPASLEPGNRLPDWIRAARELRPGGQNPQIWAYIATEISFIQSELLAVRNQYGISFDDNVCITNPGVQTLFDDYLEELCALPIDGIVFDLTDIYPNGGASSLQGISATCFCGFCLRELENAQFRDGVAPFLGDQSILRYTLQRTSTGTSNIVLDSRWHAEDLLRYSQARGFVDIPDESSKAEIVSEVRKLLTYVRARSKATAKAMRRIGNKAREHDKRIAVILRSHGFDFTTMTDAKALSDAEAASEMWIADFDILDVGQLNLPIKQYLFTSATYGVKAFFELTDEIQGGTSASKRSLVGRLVRTADRLSGNRLSPGNVDASGRFPELSGFVGIPLKLDDVADIVKNVAQRETGQILPGTLLDIIRGIPQVVESLNYQENEGNQE